MRHGVAIHTVNTKIVIAFNILVGYLQFFFWRFSVLQWSVYIQLKYVYVFGIMYNMLTLRKQNKNIFSCDLIKI
jgi:hypothetical protein